MVGRPALPSHAAQVSRGCRAEAPSRFLAAQQAQEWVSGVGGCGQCQAELPAPAWGLPGSELGECGQGCRECGRDMGPWAAIQVVRTLRERLLVAVQKLSQHPWGTAGVALTG